MSNENQIKAAAVMNLVDAMIGAFESGFTDRNFCTLSELHRIAENHVVDVYQINYRTLAERHGKELAADCGLGLTDSDIQKLPVEAAGAEKR